MSKISKIVISCTYSDMTEAEAMREWLREYIVEQKKRCDVEHPSERLTGEGSRYHVLGVARSKGRIEAAEHLLKTEFHAAENEDAPGAR